MLNQVNDRLSLNKMATIEQFKQNITSVPTLPYFDEI